MFSNWITTNNFHNSIEKKKKKIQFSLEIFEWLCGRRHERFSLDFRFQFMSAYTCACSFNDELLIIQFFFLTCYDEKVKSKRDWKRFRFIPGNQCRKIKIFTLLSSAWLLMDSFYFYLFNSKSSAWQIKHDRKHVIFLLKQIKISIMFMWLFGFNKIYCFNSQVTQTILCSWFCSLNKFIPVT